jgi:hypothetical protein
MTRLATFGTIIAVFLTTYILTGSIPSQANEYLLTATTIDSSVISSFTVLYSDMDNNAKLSDPDSPDVVLSFSGVTAQISGSQVNYATLIKTPPTGTAGPTDGSGLITEDPVTPQPLVPPVPVWKFKNQDSDFYAYTTDWTYNQTQVPLPASAFLLGSGLIPLAWLRRSNWG